MTATRLLPLLRDIGQAGALTLAQWDDTGRLAPPARPRPGQSTAAPS